VGPFTQENVGKSWVIPERIIRQSPEWAKLRPFSAPCSVTVFSSFFELGHHSRDHCFRNEIAKSANATVGFASGECGIFTLGTRW
jgi:hypothetical protein